MDVVPKGAAPGNTRKRLFADLGTPSDTKFTELSDASGKRSRVDSNSNKREAADSDTSGKVWDWFERPGDTERDELEGLDERERELRTKVLLKAPDGAYVSCRSELSSRVYFRVRDELSDSQLEDSLGKVGKLDSLLFTTVCDATELARREALFDAVRDATFKKLDSENESNWCMATCDDDSQPDRKTGPGCNALWLDRYTPRRYLDLVSDEQMNRRVLRWLKTWDAVVHGCKSERPAGGKQQSAAGSFDDQFSRLDDRGAPYWKVLVLVGPPGCGKTTLAHVAARHAGYLPVEVNASDDRSISVFRERLEAALEFRAALSNKSLQVAADSKAKLPICLVLDEIDGAPPASVKLLVDRVKADAGSKATSCKATNSDSDSDAESGQCDDKAGDVRKKKRSKPIRRPVIAICNDVYATSLRTLPVSRRDFPPKKSIKMSRKRKRVSSEKKRAEMQKLVVVVMLMLTALANARSLHVESKCIPLLYAQQSTKDAKRSSQDALQSLCSQVELPLDSETSALVRAQQVLLNQSKLHEQQQQWVTGLVLLPLGAWQGLRDANPNSRLFKTSELPNNLQAVAFHLNQIAAFQVNCSDAQSEFSNQFQEAKREQQRVAKNRGNLNDRLTQACEVIRDQVHFLEELQNYLKGYEKLLQCEYAAGNLAAFVQK